MPGRLLYDALNTTQRCQVPSGWTGPSHLLAAIHPPYQHPALAGGAAAISPPAMSAAASPPVMNCFMSPCFLEGSGSVVDVRRRVIVGETQGMLVGTHHLAGLVWPLMG